jgi:DNA-binding transcriptional MerR regulator
MSPASNVPEPQESAAASGIDPVGDVSGGLGLTVAAVARRLGVAPATLRTWDRRYGLGPTTHAAGAHRRYDSDDIARLDHMRRLVLAGVAPGDAARAARELDVSAKSGKENSQAADDAALAQMASPDEQFASSRHGGGHVVAIPGGTPAARGLARAAVSLDSGACESIIADTLSRRGVVWTWDHLLVPVLIGVGQRWEQTGTGIEVEHVLSEAVQGVLNAQVQSSFTPVNARPVLLAGSDGEAHTLPLWAIAAGLAERRISVRMLGARTPASALGAAVKRTGPAAVVLWSQTPDTGSLDNIAQLPDLRPEPAVILAGPGWQPGGSAVRRVHDLTGAIQEVARAVGA